MKEKKLSVPIPAIIICVISLFLSACLGPKKIDKWVVEQYGELPEPSKKKSNYIIITSSLPSMGSKLSTTEKHTSHVLPLLFYWQLDYKNTCTINPQIPINNFTATAQAYANKSLKQKLAGQRIELAIETIPNVFAIDDEGHLIWIIYAFGWDKISIQPDSKAMVVSYKVFNTGDSMVKSGTVTVANTDKGVGLGMFKSLKNKTLEYLTDYDAHIASMTKSVIDQITAEL